MPSIEISRKHDKTIAEARKSVERVAQQIAQRFSVKHSWDGNTLKFERPGVHGDIALTKGLVTVTVQLGFLLGALSGPVEREIKQRLEAEFG